MILAQLQRMNMMLDKGKRLREEETRGGGRSTDKFGLGAEDEVLITLRASYISRYQTRSSVRSEKATGHKHHHSSFASSVQRREGWH